MELEPEDSERVMVKVWVVFPRATISVTVSPGFLPCKAELIVFKEVTTCPSMEVMISPSWRPSRFTESALILAT